MIWAAAGVTAYLFSTLCFLLIFLKRKTINTKLAILPGIAAIACHAIYLSVHFALNEPGAYNLLLAVNVITIGISVVATGIALKFKNFFTIPVCYGVSGLILITDLFVPNNMATLAQWSIQTVSHISLALLAYALLMIATLLAFQYSFVSNRLKHHDLSILSLPMPALNQIEKQIFKVLVIGNSALTLSIATGILFLDNFFGSGQAHKAIMTIAAWGCFSALIFGHIKFGWRGRLALVLTVAGSLLLTLGYFGSRLIREILLS